MHASQVRDSVTALASHCTQSTTASPSQHLSHTALTVQFQFDLWPVKHTGNYGYHPLQHDCLSSSHSLFMFFVRL